MRIKIMVCWVMLLSVFLTGCHVQEKEELRAMIGDEVLAKEQYTPATYDAYKAALLQARTAAEQAIIGAGELQSVKNELQEKIDALCPRPDKSELTSLLQQAGLPEERQYTTDSYEELRQAMRTGDRVEKNENATQFQVDQATEALRMKINGLVPAKKGIYVITTSFSALSNPSVGKEWSHYAFYNGKTLCGEDEITAEIGSSITVFGKVIEEEVTPDVGSGSVTLLLRDQASASVEIAVRENRGRYCGNTAVWQMTCTALLIERI